MERILREGSARAEEEARRKVTYPISAERQNDEEFITLLKSAVNEKRLDTIPNEELLRTCSQAQSIVAFSNEIDIELSKTINTLLGEIKKRGLSQEKRLQELLPEEPNAKNKTFLVIMAVMVFILLSLIVLNMSKKEVFGSALNNSEYKIDNNDAVRHDAVFISLPLQNMSSFETLTYVKLAIRDSDYYNYEGAGDYDDRLKWGSDRTHIFFYKLFVRPGKKIRLMFPCPATDSFYPEILTVFGREAKWTDIVSIISFSDQIKPDPRDPLE